ncbi:single-stranded DNA-binding protein [Luteipulveratus sp. YIM 133132]|uniref:Single-stranded DNA-binding protein n=1 Tax=Luteipulveratus flavus TaxID=3031728 RepID=A0ABT6C5P2_9MICO|nr:MULTISPECIES: single-stranded DNA-binding protein [unclassified Luteipulveratus]MDE9366096.1 single-stranded DNA-binding protein [Luteipulveratus sp. YIM 133132]MDF8264202.1 single-stranded DNA-binding protein [Luteipulveratus sp. YIM 133296]
MDTSVNEVRLVGRVSGSPVHRVLPSDDELVTFRLVVDRPVKARSTSSGRQVRVDTIDIACWTSRTRRRAIALESGECVEVSGALRRRFWRAGAAAVSRCEVEAASIDRLRVGAA